MRMRFKPYARPELLACDFHVHEPLTHGKRIFRMTPIHHAFEMRGWKEVKIDFFFSLIAIIGVVLGLMYVYMA